MLAGWCERESPVRKRKRDVRDISQTTGQVDYDSILLDGERERENDVYACMSTY